MSEDKYACPACHASEFDRNHHSTQVLHKLRDVQEAGYKMVVNLCNPGGREIHFKGPNEERHRLQISDQCCRCDEEKIVSFIDALIKKTGK